MDGYFGPNDNTKVGKESLIKTMEILMKIKIDPQYN